MSKDERPTVWSSERGDLRRAKRDPILKRSLPPNQQTIFLHRESKGRGGKTVTLVKSLVLSKKDMKALAKKLKRACGSGGTVKNEIIEIQGEHREKIARVLEKMGFKVKVSGG